jgi:hypothetical protein
LLTRGASGKAEIIAIQRLDRRKACRAGKHIPRPCTARFPLALQRILKEVSERRIPCRSCLSIRQVKIRHRRQMQFRTEFSNPRMLQFVHGEASMLSAVGNSVSYNASGCCSPTSGRSNGGDAAAIATLGSPP